MDESMRALCSEVVLLREQMAKSMNGLLAEVAALCEEMGRKQGVPGPAERATCGCCADAWDVCRAYGCDEELVQEFQEGTPLHAACGSGKLDLTQHLLAHHGGMAWLNTRDAYGRTPLYIASAYEGCLELVHELTLRGADIHIPDNEGKSALYGASYSGHLGAVKELLTRGASADMVDNDGDTALCIASYNGHTEIVRELISKGADMDRPCHNGGTALYWAAAAGHLPTVLELVVRGAKLDIKTCNGERPVDAARRAGHVAVAKLLVDTWNSVNTESPLHA
eukprot:TRINITY_DN19117_c0_g1_i1.p1 TRINITY_DN19117_c0_g1~~TRINITY_DN19117_c0_g1_i1.p1  ORF type:complete len:294 (+),score=61.18 TRINITY_DN19117_c0_g1_i1:42-884(+)